MQISMDGRDWVPDNIFTECLWRSVKYEEVYLNEYEHPRCASLDIGRYLSFYNLESPAKPWATAPGPSILFVDQQTGRRHIPFIAFRATGRTGRTEGRQTVASLSALPFGLRCGAQVGRHRCPILCTRSAIVPLALGNFLRFCRTE